MRLDEKVAIITGAASGFGAGMARHFVEQGAAVYIADLNEEAGKALASELGSKANFVRTDVTARMDISNLVKTALADHGRLDIVVNNAGYSHLNQPMTDVGEEDFDKTFGVNVKGIFHMTQICVPVFEQHGAGVILNIASTAGIRPRPGLCWYNASKGAVITATKAMAIELADRKIRVNALCPVAGDTPLLATFMGEDTPEKREAFRKSIPLGRLSTPEDIAMAAVYLCSDEASLITGVALEVDGGRCI